MRRVLLALGINKVTGLPPLEDAVRGAHEMAEWAKSQNFDTIHCITCASSLPFECRRMC